MGCPTVINPPWTPPGWGPASLGAGAVAQIVPPTSVIPTGASLALIQFSVRGPTPGDAVLITDSAGNQLGNPVRVQTANIFDDTLGFAPIVNGGIYIRNVSGDTLDVWVVFLGYS